MAQLTGLEHPTKTPYWSAKFRPNIAEKPSWVKYFGLFPGLIRAFGW
jgi:hypothetical protein